MRRLAVSRHLILVGLVAPLTLAGCSPVPRDCWPEPDRFSTARNPARASDQEVRTPAAGAAGAAVAAFAAASLLTGQRCEWRPRDASAPAPPGRRAPSA